MASLVKRWPCKCEDLSSISRTHLKKIQKNKTKKAAAKPGMVVCMEEVGIGRSLELSGQSGLTYLVTYSDCVY